MEAGLAVRLAAETRLEARLAVEWNLLEERSSDVQKSFCLFESE